MTIASLFDGSGGFPLAATMYGITPIWASEIEPYPIAVSSYHFPNMKHYGSVSDINGKDVEPVDIVSFSSPCQDLSKAGKREGIKHSSKGDITDTRSGLFYEATRIIKEIRHETNGLAPRYAIWENVHGVLSSNKGEDFKKVLQEIIEIAEPNAPMLEIPKGGWSYYDCFHGEGWSIAYRTLDAQYWGVPQRRRRIYLVADFGGDRAKEILFNEEPVRVSSKEIAEKFGYFAENPGRSSTEFVKGVNGTFNTFYFARQTYSEYKISGLAATLTAHLDKDFIDIVVTKNKDEKYSIRRITPTECARLQGYPFDWGCLNRKTELSKKEYCFWNNVRKTHEKINGKKGRPYSQDKTLYWYNKLLNDNNQYKMWGNGICLYNALYIMHGITNTKGN
jgi:DNA (cytosine-5)-methyltransferase 1